MLLQVTDVAQAAKLAQEAAKLAEPVTVRSTGWSPTSIGVWTLVAVMTPLVIALFRLWPAMRKLRNESDGSLRGDLLKRIQALEAAQVTERTQHQAEMMALQNKLDAVVRQFVQFQLTVVRHMPSEFAPEIQRASANLMAVIARDVSEFTPDELMAGSGPVAEPGEAAPAGPDA